MHNLTTYPARYFYKGAAEALDRPARGQRRFRSALALLFTGLTPLLLGTSGCAVGPDYQRPQDPPVQVQAPAGVDIASIERHWWGQFNDPELNSLVQQALAGNATLAAAKARVQSAYALLDDRENDILPSGDIGVDYSAGKAPVAPAYSTRVKDEHFRSGASLTWEPDLFGRIRRAVEVAEAQAEASDAALRQVQVEVIAAVVETYGDLRATQQRIQVARQNLNNLQEVVRLTEFRYSSGASTELDVARTRAQYAGTEAGLPPLQARVQRDLRQLEVLTGQPPGTLAGGLELPSDLPTVNRALQLGDPTDLLRRRPDIQIAERQLAAATANVGVATADLFPRVEMSGFLGFVSASGSRLYEEDSRAWSVAPTLHWPLFDLGSVKARIRLSEFEADAQLHDYRHTVLTALQQTQNALSDYTQRQNRLRLLLEQESHSARSQSLAQAQYRAGLIDLLDILDTERTRLAAEDAVVQAELEMYQGVVDLYRALGGGWEPAA